MSDLDRLANDKAGIRPVACRHSGLMLGRCRKIGVGDRDRAAQEKDSAQQARDKSKA
jgi:hypothetical protein